MAGLKFSEQMLCVESLFLNINLVHQFPEALLRLFIIPNLLRQPFSGYADGAMIYTKHLPVRRNKNNQIQDFSPRIS